MVIHQVQRAIRIALGAVCIVILCVLLTAGLWPFCAPRNGVAWKARKNGLQFGPTGVVTSQESLHMAAPGGDCTLELLLQPAQIKGNGTFLAFDSSSDPQSPFDVQQLWEDMAIQRAAIDAEGRPTRLWLETNRVFQAGQLTLLTITGEPHLTTVYVNGSPAKVSSSFGFSSSDIAGRSVLGSSTVHGSWSGQIAGLAIYDAALSPVEVQMHSQRWSRGESPVTTGEHQPVALYRFNEGSGNTVHDLSGHGGDLVIPSRYFVLHPGFLKSPLGDFLDRYSGWRSRSYWANVCLNVAGFVPMGFFFTVYFSLIWPLRRSRITVVAMGLAVSLTIEIGQYFLPTRDSGINDLITNTLGTAVGVLLCSPGLVCWVASKFSTTSSGPVRS
jgi:hypothetical protein